MPIALMTEPCARTTAINRPSAIKEKYSGAPNDMPRHSSDMLATIHDVRVSTERASDGRASVLFVVKRIPGGQQSQRAAAQVLSRGELEVLLCSWE